MELKEMLLSKLKLNTGQIEDVPKNPRFIKDERFEKLKQSLQDYPDMLKLREIIAYDNNDELVVVCGNMRLRALRELKVKEGYVKILPSDTDKKKIRAYTILDNNEFGEDDFDLLADEWDQEELKEWGFDDIDFGIDEEEEIEEDEAPEVQEESIVKKGEIWCLGNHKLICGDATNIDDVKKLMGGEKADFGFCDPPYNLGFEYNNYNDNKTEKEYNNFTNEWFDNLYIFTERQCITLGTKNIQLAVNQKGILSGVACWVKKNWITSCKIAKLQQWEPIVFYGDYSNYKRISDLFEINRIDQKDIDSHPCQKQLKFIVDILKNYSNKIVLDLFGGSGTTLIACEQLNRKCRMMEIDERYCDVILKRWINWMIKNDKEITNLTLNGKEFDYNSFLV